MHTVWPAYGPSENSNFSQKGFPRHGNNKTLGQGREIIEPLFTAIIHPPIKHPHVFPNQRRNRGKGGKEKSRKAREAAS